MSKRDEIAERIRAQAEADRSARFVENWTRSLHGAPPLRPSPAEHPNAAVDRWNKYVESQLAPSPARRWSRAARWAQALVLAVTGIANMYVESLTQATPGVGFALGMIGLLWAGWILGRGK